VTIHFGGSRDEGGDVLLIKYVEGGGGGGGGGIIKDFLIGNGIFTRGFGAWKRFKPRVKRLVFGE